MSNPFGQPPNQGGFGGHPPNQGFGQPPGGQGFGPPGAPGGHGFGPPVAQPMAAANIDTGPAMFVGIGVAMFCGCLPGGILAIVFADQAKKAAARGDALEAQKKLKLSYITSAVSVGLLALVPCIYFAFMLVLGGAGALAS